MDPVAFSDSPFCCLDVVDSTVAPTGGAAAVVPGTVTYPVTVPVVAGGGAVEPPPPPPHPDPDTITKANMVAARVRMMRVGLDMEFSWSH